MENKDLKKVINQLSDIGDIISKIKPYNDEEQECALDCINRIKKFVHRQSLSDKVNVLNDYALATIVIKNDDDIKEIVTISDQYTLFTALISIEYYISIHGSLYGLQYKSDKPMLIMIHPNMVLIRKDIAKSFQYCIYNSSNYILPGFKKIIDQQYDGYFLYIDKWENNTLSMLDHMTENKIDALTGIINNNVDYLDQYFKESLRNYDSNVERLKRFLTKLSDSKTAEDIIWKLTRTIEYYIKYLSDYFADHYEKEYKDELIKITKSLSKIRGVLITEELNEDENNKFTKYMKSLFPIKSKSRKEQRAYAACYQFSTAQPYEFPYHDLEKLFLNMLICDLFEQIIKNYPEFDYRATE